MFQPLPRWVNAGDHRVAGSSSRSKTAVGGITGHDAISAGAALFALDQIIRAEPPFLGAWRMRIALQAAVSASRLLRARADEAELRDTLHLTRDGDEPGPAGRAHLLLRRLAHNPVRLALAQLEALGALSKGDGVAELLALLREDIALAEWLGWHRPLPLHLMAAYDPAIRGDAEGRRIRVGAPGWEQIRHAVAARAAIAAHQMAVTLAGRAEKLIAAAETLRTRDGEAGLALILGDDCVAPWRMAGGEARAASTGMGSDRAARRFCESLHAKGALRLLTPRPTFRLYGL
ncbi:MAG: DUF1403 family protein [Proteobacteria bacterium]|nr:DUF1403 family protein [Pseudomonadota bacterium]